MEWTQELHIPQMEAQHPLLTILLRPESQKQRCLS